MRPWHQVSRHEPCPICGKSDWCSRSADSNWVACRRLDTSDGIHRVDKAGIDYWLYQRDRNLPHRHATRELSIVRTRTPAPPDILNRLYQALLGMLPLEQRHR